MKCQKTTYLSTLCGSVECEELFKTTYGRVDFGSHGVYNLIHREPVIREFLEDHKEDLTKHLPEELRGLVIKAEFGDYYEDCGKSYLATKIYTRAVTTEEQEQAIREWIIGQLSDGWGEGLSNECAYDEEIDKCSTTFDEDLCEFDEEAYVVDAYYYLLPHGFEDFEFFAMDYSEEVDINIPIQEPIVNSSSCQLNDDRTYTVRTVYYIEDKLSAIQFIVNSGIEHNSEILRLIDEQGCLGPKVSFYVVHENTGLHSKFLPIVGIANEDTASARIFTINEETGEIDFTDHENDFRHFFWKLNGK